MTLGNETNIVRMLRKLNNQHISLDVDYTLLIKKGVALHLQCSPIEFAAKCAQDYRDVDLWTNGKIYPPIP